jgi:hypothetical protein
LETLGLSAFEFIQCTASLVMYHELVTKELGQFNIIVTILRGLAREHHMYGFEFFKVGPEQLLVIYSGIILEDFQVRSP